MYSPLIDELMQAFRVLPGVGPKSAQRMAFHLLERDKEGATKLAKALTDAVEGVGRCDCCQTLTEQSLCRICANPRRDSSVVCVVENPSDIIIFEQSGAYQGFYFVLHGHLSPIDGIGPSDLGLDLLESRFSGGDIKEVVLATNSTVEGEATAHYISEIAKSHNMLVSKLAQGVPLGGELEYLDGGTLAHAISSRTRVE